MGWHVAVLNTRIYPERWAWTAASWPWRRARPLTEVRRGEHTTLTIMRGTVRPVRALRTRDPRRGQVSPRTLRGTVSGQNRDFAGQNCAQLGQSQGSQPKVGPFHSRMCVQSRSVACVFSPVQSHARGAGIPSGDRQSGHVYKGCCTADRIHSTAPDHAVGGVGLGGVGGPSL